MDDGFIDSLLFEEEGTALDFKQEQYKFIASNKTEKSELLKDILAFANSWKRSDAYILIGVKEIKGSKNEVLGIPISEHFDDAAIQQFVNSKTNQPLEFSYIAQGHSGNQIGIIKIPQQNRPFYIEKDFGIVKKQTVYIRRGSSTEIAKPDEISRMGIDVYEGRDDISLSLSLADINNHKHLGDEIILVSSRIILPEYIPKLSKLMVNSAYYQEYAKYYKERAEINPIGFVLENTGNVLIMNPVVRIVQNKIPGLIILDSYDAPHCPGYNLLTSSMRHVPTVFNKGPDTVVYDRGDFWDIEITLNNIKPKDKCWSEYFYIGSQVENVLSIEANVYADNLPQPISKRFEVVIKSEEIILSMEELLSKANSDEDQ